MADSSTSAPAISLPKGGGALHGLGEKFSPDLHTGTGNFTVPITIPKGRNGFQPQLSLVYSTGNGNGIFGLGWTLSVPGITRKTSKGVPQYDDARDVFLLSGAEDLVAVRNPDSKSTRYQPRTEGLFARILHHHDAPGKGDYWEVRSKDGLVSLYGTPKPSPLPLGWRDPAVIRDPDVLRRDHIFAWELTQTRDPFGNLIRYEYDKRDAGDSGPHHWEQPLLSAIRYVDYGSAGNPQFLISVEFDYEERSTDPLSEYRAGFEIRTSMRCTSITVKTHTQQEYTVRRYRFEYQSDPHNGASLLHRIQVVGFDDIGNDSEELPPLEFGYSRFEPERRRFIPLTGDDFPPHSLGHPDYELVDLFGNGLPDVLEMSGNVRYWRNLGEGLFDRPRAMWEAPPSIHLADSGVQLVDANGDGRSDLLVTTATQAGYFPLTFDGTWDKKSFQPYAAAPSFSLEDPEVRLVDLDGDGVTDAIRSGTRLECFFNDPDEGWKGRTRWLERRQLEEFPDINFSDPRVKWADMVGDGLQDIVLVHDGNVEYWPNRGHGDWGARIHMEESPRFPYGYDPRRILLGDVDGDGLADLIYVDHRRVLLWLNQSGNGWSSEPIVIGGTPSVTDQDSVRLVDLLGMGVGGVLWSAEATGSVGTRAFFLDFAGGIKPYLLNQMKNHLGAVTKVEYAPSTRFFLEDQKQVTTRWRTPLPFPVQVVSRVEVIDAISKGKLATEYRYHHGYWDGAEREFRGFGLVEQLDTETFTAFNRPGLHGEDAEFVKVESQFSPPLLTKTWFHQGPVGEEFGDWQELDLEDEYWSGDPQCLRHTDGLNQFLATLPRRRVRRDALRALRGSVLRTELYALDGSARRDRPYTVTEQAYGLREESPPHDDDVVRPHIFFPHLLAQRTTQWERGGDPLTQLAFTGSYEAYGQPRSQIDIAVPRGRDYVNALPEGSAEIGKYLATHIVTTYAQRDDAEAYIVDRVARTTTYEIPNDGRDELFTFVRTIEKLTLDLPDNVVAETLNFYDGPALVGLAFSEIGDYGALVRSENLILTRSLLEEAYGSGNTLLESTGEPPYLTTNGPLNWSSDYPLEFRTRLPVMAGFSSQPAGATSEFTPGYFSATERRRYDFHGTSGKGRGLVKQQRDPLGHERLISYDAPYNLLPVETRHIVDPALPPARRSLVTTAAYSYRAMQPRRFTDPNGNRIDLAYSPLGLLTESWIKGKDDPQRPEGDWIKPSVKLEYDFRAFQDRAEPTFVRTIRRIHHDTETGVPQPERDRTVESREYTDGFGRLLQIRTQGDEIRFGDATLGGGDEVLPPRQAAGSGSTLMGLANSSADNPNVIVSGWKIHDNKGRLIEDYEPFFTQGWGYTEPPSSVLTRCQRVIMYYDSRGRVMTRLNPDGSEQRMVYGVPVDPGDPDTFEPTPWEIYTYDANDNAGRTHGSGAQEYRHHWNTPTNVVIDALGRVIETTELYREKPARPSDPLSPLVRYRTSSSYDIRGNLRTVTDALGREAFTYTYDLANHPIRTVSRDGGVRRTVLDAAGNLIEERDSKGSLELRAYDNLNRPIRLWARNNGGDSVTLREKLVYGDSIAAGLTRTQAVRVNLLGRLYRHQDEAGLVTFAALGADTKPISAYDFRGNLLEKNRRVIADSSIGSALAATPGTAKTYVVDWDLPPALEGDYQSSMTYDALNRMVSMRYPRDVAGNRRKLALSYNRAGALQRVKLGTATFVDRIDYNAKGQRTFIAYGNAIMTRYAYDPATFKLLRLRTEGYSKPSALRYAPAGAVLEDSAYEYDLIGNILRLIEQAPGCGVRNNPQALRFPDLQALVGAGDALVRRFEYDPLYRLILATGREAKTLGSPRPWQDLPQSGFNWSGTSGRTPANAKDRTRIYTERYRYDSVGNLLTLKHSKGWTRYFGMSGFTPQQWQAKVKDLVTGGTPAWGEANNRLTHFGNTLTQSSSHAFDVNGNLVREFGNRHFGWDHADRMVAFSATAASGSETSEAHYLYGADGLRVKKWVPLGSAGVGGSAVYIDSTFEYHRWKEVGVAQAKHNSRLNVMDNQSRIAVVRVGDIHSKDKGEPVQYHLGDHLGSSTVVLGGANPAAHEFINREEFFPYGETSFGSYGKKRYRFTGKERDEESGLNYHDARYYAPWLGRWISADPRGLAADVNLYIGFACNPLTRVDPSGTDDVPGTLLQQPQGTEDFYGQERGHYRTRIEAMEGGGLKEVREFVVHQPDIHLVRETELLAAKNRLSLWYMDYLLWKGLRPSTPPLQLDELVSLMTADPSRDLRQLPNESLSGMSFRAADPANPPRPIPSRESELIDSAKRSLSPFPEHQTKLMYAAIQEHLVPLLLVRGFQFAAMLLRGPGVIYGRLNPSTGGLYVGQARSWEHYLFRRAAHDARLGVAHDYFILARPWPGKRGIALDLVEETWMRHAGRPWSGGGLLENSRYQMRDTAYRLLGGTEPLH